MQHRHSKPTRSQDQRWRRHGFTHCVVLYCAYTASTAAAPVDADCGHLEHSHSAQWGDAVICRTLQSLIHSHQIQRTHNGNYTRFIQPCAAAAAVAAIATRRRRDDARLSKENCEQIGPCERDAPHIVSTRAYMTFINMRISASACNARWQCL